MADIDVSNTEIVTVYAGDVDSTAVADAKAVLAAKADPGQTDPSDSALLSAIAVVLTE